MITFAALPNTEFNLFTTLCASLYHRYTPLHKNKLRILTNPSHAVKISP